MLMFLIGWSHSFSIPSIFGKTKSSSYSRHRVKCCLIFSTSYFELMGKIPCKISAAKAFFVTLLRLLRKLSHTRTRPLKLQDGLWFASGLFHHAITANVDYQQDDMVLSFANLILTEKSPCYRLLCILIFAQHPLKYRLTRYLLTEVYFYPVLLNGNLCFLSTFLIALQDLLLKFYWQWQCFSSKLSQL